MKWLDRVRKTAEAPPVAPTKPTEATFVGSVGSPPAPFSEIVGFNDPEVSVDCPPNFLDEAPAVVTAAASPASNPESDVVLDRASAPGADPAEPSDAHMALVMLFQRRGVRNEEADQLALDVAARTFNLDDHHICLECRRLNGKRCTVPTLAQAGEIVTPFLRWPMRCPGFEAAA